MESDPFETDRDREHGALIDFIVAFERVSNELHLTQPGIALFRKHAGLLERLRPELEARQGELSKLASSVKADDLERMRLEAAQGLVPVVDLPHGVKVVQEEGPSWDLRSPYSGVVLRLTENHDGEFTVTTDAGSATLAGDSIKIDATPNVSINADLDIEVAERPPKTIDDYTQDEDLAESLCKRTDTFSEYVTDVRRDGEQFEDEVLATVTLTRVPVVQS